MNRDRARSPNLPLTLVLPLFCLHIGGHLTISTFSPGVRHLLRTSPRIPVCFLENSQGGTKQPRPICLVTPAYRI